MYGTTEFITNMNGLIPKSIKGRVVKRRLSHSEIIWTNKKARNFGTWLFENNELPKYVKYVKFSKYMEEFNNIPKLSERMSKPVIQLDENNNIINEYKSTIDVLNKTNIRVGNCLIGLTKTAGGYYWKYK